jgi:hypothetical protein
MMYRRVRERKDLPSALAIRTRQDGRMYMHKLILLLASALPPIPLHPSPVPAHAQLAAISARHASSTLLPAAYVPSTSIRIIGIHDPPRTNHATPA